MDCLQLFGCHTFTGGKVAFISLVFVRLACRARALYVGFGFPLTSCDFGINFDSGISRDQLFGKLDPLMNGDSRSMLISHHYLPTRRLLSAYPCPTIASCFILRKWSAVSFSTCSILKRLLAHAKHPVNLLDAQPMQDVRHESLESHVFDTSNVLSSLEVV